MIGDLVIETPGRSLLPLTAELNGWLSSVEAREGVLHVFVLHTSASLILNENADPDVLSDLETWMSSAVVDGDSRFLHRDEGPDDMAAHVRSTLTQSSLMLPVRDGRLSLGVWQQPYLWEHRYASHRRRLRLTFLST